MRTQLILRYGLIIALLCDVTVVDGQAGTAEERSGSIPRDGFRLYYRIVGASGPYVILLGGGPGIDVDYLASAVEGLKSSNRVVLLEQRGTGRSVMPVLDDSTLSWGSYLSDLEALRIGLGEERLTLIGHSWGMMYGLAYAAAYPDCTRGVITLGSGPITADFNRQFDDNRTMRLHPSERELLDYWSAPERLRAAPDRAFFEYLRAITPTDFWDRKDGIEFAMRWRLEWCHGRIADVTSRTIYARLDMRPELDKITAPVLFIQGYQDVAGEANVLEAARHIKHAQVLFLHRAGHYTWLDQPQATWGAVLPFLAQLR